MIGRILDKLLFGTALLLALQVPLLVDHYQQFLSGLYESTKWQVEGYEATAKKYEYSSLRSMIDHHLQNDVKSVREDAHQKLLTLDLFDELSKGIQIFNDGHLIDKAIFMLHPSRYVYLEKTIQHFKIGIPLSATGLTFGVVVAFIIHLLLTWPFIAVSRRASRNKVRRDPSSRTSRM
ncbi:DUF2937 family protein [Marinomonas balearica]|uniref:DUF2937 family protein n=1 Tax=Marinomonas balearica TaxID=491947 RepID=A0A4R6M8Y6_9GAMM|nr:DUF2937 family protein [Marinomonas balearica]TDO97951.1 DUF2937 family protein [Marinomonas balearica]